MGEAIEPRSYRRPLVRFGIGLIWLVPVAVLAPFALDLGPGGSVPTGQRIAYAAICVPFVVLAVRTFRIGVFTRPEGVVVRGVLRSWKLRWEDVKAFEWGEWRGWGGFDCGVVRRADGSQLTVFALNPPFELESGQARGVPQMLAELNEQLAQARGWSQPPPSGAPDPFGPPPPEAVHPR